MHIAGTTDGCPESLTHSPYLTSAQEYYEHYKTVIQRQDWIDKGAVDERYDCFGDRRLCDNNLYNPQDPEKYSTILMGGEATVGISEDSAHGGKVSHAVNES